MNIWIVDDQVSFARELKELIKAPHLIRPQIQDLKISTFHDTQEFIEKIEKLKKMPSKKPDLIFMDVEIGKESGLKLYESLIQDHQDIAKVIVFCSAMSYGRFVGYFESLSQTPPPFVQKSQIETALNNIVQKYIPSNEKDQKEIGGYHFSGPFVARQKKSLEETFNQLQNLYYNEGFHEKTLTQFINMAHGVEDLTHALGFGDVVSMAKDLQVHLGRERAHAMKRVKTELKEFIIYLGKVVEKVK